MFLRLCLFFSFSLFFFAFTFFALVSVFPLCPRCMSVSSALSLRSVVSPLWQVRASLRLSEAVLSSLLRHFHVTLFAPFPSLQIMQEKIAAEGYVNPDDPDGPKAKFKAVAVLNLVQVCCTLMSTAAVVDTACRFLRLFLCHFVFLSLSPSLLLSIYKYLTHTLSLSLPSPLSLHSLPPLPFHRPRAPVPSACWRLWRRAQASLLRHLLPSSSSASPPPLHHRLGTTP